MAPDTSLHIQPLTPQRWADFEKLFGKNGAYGGCWCMYWRIARSEFSRQSGEGNRQALKALVDEGVVPGVLAYLDGEPAGWCSLAPREEFASLERSRTLKRLDDRPVWSIVCFFVGKPYRQQGLMLRLIQGAVAYAAGQGARIVEAYPADPGEKHLPPVSSYMGLVEIFRQAGFVEVKRPSPSHVMMQYEIG
jgi:GNAT superfamily N-acetyltransferase